MDSSTKPPIYDDSNVLLTRGEVREFAASLRQFAHHMIPIPFLRGLASRLDELAESIDGKPTSVGQSRAEMQFEKPRSWCKGWPWMARPMFGAVSSVRGQFMRQRLPDLEQVAQRFGVDAADLAACLRSAPHSPNGAWARDFFRVTEEG